MRVRDLPANPSTLPDALRPDSAHEQPYWRRTPQELIAVGTATVLAFTLAGCGSGEGDVKARNVPDASTFYVDSSSQYYNDLSTSLGYIDDPDARQTIEQIKETPIAEWLTNSSITETQTDITETIARSQATGTIPVFVTYNLPDRDLGGESAGGISSPEEYQRWIAGIAETVDSNDAIVIIEPDGLPGTLQIKNEADRDKRLSMLRSALETFQSNENTAVYIDAGHSSWLSVEQVAELFRRVDPDSDLITGVSLNVSNQRSTEETAAYASRLRVVLGRDIYSLIDVSMNGADNTDQLTEFCNPDGEKVGTPKDLLFDPNQLDEEIFVKEPGRSDGSCGTSDAPAGEFDGDLLRRQTG